MYIIWYVIKQKLKSEFHVIKIKFKLLQIFKNV